MNNLLVAAQQQHVVIRKELWLSLSHVKQLLTDLENVMSFENLPPAEAAAANELHSRYVNLENQLRYFVEKG